MASGAAGRGAGGAADRVTVLGVAVDRLTMAEAVRRAEELALSWDGGRTNLVATPNPEIIYSARHDPTLRRALAAADLTVADGTGLVWAARRLGRPVPERVTGVDLLDRLLDLAARQGYRVFFLGTRDEVMAGAVAAARDRYPGLEVAGSHHGYFRPEEEGAVIAAIREARPQFLFTGMGFPRDQIWTWRHRDELGAAVAMGVGGSFDVMAGVVRRAPAWMRSLRLEWFYRLVTQPRRWRRMLVLPRFVWAVLREEG